MSTQFLHFVGVLVAKPSSQIMRFTSALLVFLLSEATQTNHLRDTMNTVSKTPPHSPIRQNEDMGPQGYRVLRTF